MESALHRHTTHVAAQPGMQSVLGGSDLSELMTLVRAYQGLWPPRPSADQSVCLLPALIALARASCCPTMHRMRCPHGQVA